MRVSKGCHYAFSNLDLHNIMIPENSSRSAMPLIFAGFNVETINYENLKLITWDLSAKEKVVSLLFIYTVYVHSYMYVCILEITLE